jgi:pimeloyl-ACP methyl ester carboxylesterase
VALSFNCGFKVTGALHRPAVVLLHSSLSTGAQWQALTKQLDADFCCINIDLLGYGDAPEVSDLVANAADYQLTTEVERVMAIIDSLIGDASFSIVGHSYGGAVGLRLAHLVEKKAQKKMQMQQASRLSSMVLYEPVAFHLLDPNHEIEGAAYREITQIANPLVNLSPRIAAQSFIDYWNYDGFFATLPSKVQQLFSDKMAKVSLDFQALMGEPCTIDDYQFNDCPVLVMEGESSRLSAKILAKRLATGLPNASHQVFAGGHMAPVADSVAVAEVIGGFLRGQV